MYQWFNRSHPQTLQAAVFLGYFAGVFSLLGGGGAIALLISIGLIAGAFGVANSKRIGYYALAVAASLRALLYVAILIRPASPQVMDILGFTRGFILRLEALNNLVFPIALVAAILHSHSRQYQKVWFQ